jgi:RNA polymerase sigma factor FliA
MPSAHCTAAPPDRAAALVGEHAGWARLTARRLARAYPRGMAEDLEAAALPALWEAARRYDPARGASFRTFAYWCVRGALRDWARRTGQNRCARHPSRPEKLFSLQALLRPRRQGDGSGEFLGLEPDPKQPDPSHGQQARDLLAACLRGCSARERSLLLLYYCEGLTMGQVGAALGCAESWVSVLHRDLLARLREDLAHRRAEWGGGRDGPGL